MITDDLRSPSKYPHVLNLLEATDYQKAKKNKKSNKIKNGIRLLIVSEASLKLVDHSPTHNISKQKVSS